MKTTTAGSQQALGSIVYERGNLEQAQALFQFSLDLATRLGDQRFQVSALKSLGVVAAAKRRYGQAREYLGEALDYFRQAGTSARIASTLISLGAIAAEGGR
jgi:tetratricopeptide (TPR) repeat protein